MAREGGTRRRHAILGLVIVVHVLLIALAVWHQESIAVRHASSAPLIFLTSTAPVAPPNPPPKAVSPARDSEMRRVVPPTKPERQVTGDFAISLDAQAPSSLEALPLGLGIDWDREAATIATSQAASLFRELKHLCEEAARRGEQPPGCHKYRRPDPWSPEPKKFGFSGGLPYVRLGKRCVLGLGFFGCGVGKLPEADGHVFDDMRDPDRPRSSVPDPNE
jgi:hypothetical protein